MTQYSIPTSARMSFDAYIEEWITNGWLEPYDDKKLGYAKGLIPLMAIVRRLVPADTSPRIPVALPDCDLSWSNVLPHEVGVWIECGAQCDEVCGRIRLVKFRHIRSYWLVVSNNFVFDWFRK